MPTFAAPIMRAHWYKVLGAILVLYSIIAGFLGKAPGQVGMLDETIRNLFFHVPMWFTMLFLLLLSVISALKYLSSQDPLDDTRSYQAVHVALLFGILGLATGSLWAQFTWGKPWTKDPKLNGVAIGMLMYLAYMILRASIDDPQKRGRVAAVYNIFAFPIFVVLIYVLPKMTSFSIHPGNGDNAGFATYDLNSDLRKVFYPAVIGWIMIGTWMFNLRTRIKNIENQDEEIIS